METTRPCAKGRVKAWDRLSSYLQTDSTGHVATAEDFKWLKLVVQYLRIEKQEVPVRQRSLVRSSTLPRETCRCAGSYLKCRTGRSASGSAHRGWCLHVLDPRVVKTWIGSQSVSRGWRPFQLILARSTGCPRVLRPNSRKSETV